MEKIFKNQWVILHPSGNVQLWTLESTKRYCIAKFLDGGTMTWAECKKIGWTVVKTTLKLEW